MNKLKGKVAIVTGASKRGQTPPGRIGQVDDIAPIVSCRASDDAGWMTGEIILASGGMR
jgi:3-oxoacyl-[acyl-carrier protein] reductase